MRRKIDKYEICTEINKLMDNETFESFDAHSKPILGVSKKCEEPQPKNKEINQFELKS